MFRVKILTNQHTSLVYRRRWVVHPKIPSYIRFGGTRRRTTGKCTIWLKQQIVAFFRDFLVFSSRRPRSQTSFFYVAVYTLNDLSESQESSQHHLVKRQVDNRRVVCYYANWAVYRQGTAKFSPQNINPYLCTHLIYAFAGLGKDDKIQTFDKYQDLEKGNKEIFSSSLYHKRCNSFCKNRKKSCRKSFLQRKN